MAIQTHRFRDYRQKQEAAEALADQLAAEQEEESSFGSFLSIAAPLAASLILPGVGTALMGGLSGMGALGGGLASAFGGTAFGGGAAGTMLGGLLTGGAKGLGTYAIGEGMEGIGREVGYGGEVEDIDLSQFGRHGIKAQKQGRESISSMKDAMEKGQVSSALMSGALGGIDKMGGFDKMKEMSADFGKKLSGQTKAGGYFNPADKGVGIGKTKGVDLVKDIQSPTLAKDVTKGGAEKLATTEADSIAEAMGTPSLPELTTKGSPLNFLTGDGAQANLLDSTDFPSYGRSILDEINRSISSNVGSIVGDESFNIQSLYDMELTDDIISGMDEGQLLEYINLFGGK